MGTRSSSKDRRWMQRIQANTSTTMKELKQINTKYGEDTVLIAGYENKRQLILERVGEESGKRGLVLNIKKTECMAVSKKGQISTCNISCKGDNIQKHISINS
ncbi:hypothetical protein PoB_000599300 [Plakobranchus ocellatus]|uniref:Uncharacterized protein n=1 Tax=Plakobranchus ocellatus TaxID=259542 RepID=A0AAV3YAF1_9GAST|nr:hypothetical protein PoB_000599300 [Plakobranchus ocellatus]